jgi:hypothetical protein
MEFSTAEWMPIAELKPRFGISRATGYRLIAAGLIEARKVGARTTVNVPSVRRYHANLPAPAVKQDSRSARLAAVSRT